MLRRTVIDFTQTLQTWDGFDINDSELALVGFARNGTQHPDAFVVINIGQEAKDLTLEIPGSTSPFFSVFRSDDDERYVALGAFTANAAGIAYQAPPRSVTTFYGQR